MRYIGRHKKDSGKYPSLLLSVGKLSESRRLNLNRLISAPSTLALKWLVFRRDYCCEQNSPHYEPHTNSSCYEEATFAEANSDKQDYATNLPGERQVLAFHPRVLRPRTRPPIMFKEVFKRFLNSGRHDLANGPVNEGLGFHPKRLPLPTNDPNQIRLFETSSVIEIVDCENYQSVSRDVLWSAEALLFFLFRIQPSSRHSRRHIFVPDTQSNVTNKGLIIFFENKRHREWTTKWLTRVGARRPPVGVAAPPVRDTSHFERTPKGSNEVFEHWIRMLVNVLDEENICWGTVWGSDGGVDPRQCQQEPLHHCVSERRASRPPAPGAGGASESLFRS